MTMHAAFRQLADNREDLELVREFSQPVDRVWAALTTPARIEAWMGVEWLSGRDAPLKEGAAFDYRFQNSGMDTRGRVLRWAPTHLFEHSWHEDTPYASTVCWRLEPTAGGCRLTLTHRFPVKEDLPRTAAGWTMLMGSLDAWLADQPFQPDKSWRTLRDQYAESFGPEATRDGRLAEADGEKALRFERVLHRPIARVWTALTTPAGIKGWLQATAEVEPRAGGRISLTFHSGGDHTMTGEVLAFDAPRVFEFTWPEAVAGENSIVRFTLEPQGEAACRLVLTHRLPNAEDTAGFASGWHWHLDGVERAADGVDTAWDEARWRVLKTMYEMTLTLV